MINLDKHMSRQKRKIILFMDKLHNIFLNSKTKISNNSFLLKGYVTKSSTFVKISNNITKKKQVISRTLESIESKQEHTKVYFWCIKYSSLIKISIPSDDVILQETFNREDLVVWANLNFQVSFEEVAGFDNHWNSLDSIYRRRDYVQENKSSDEEIKPNFFNNKIMINDSKSAIITLQKYEKKNIMMSFFQHKEIKCSNKLKKNVKQWK